MRVFKLFRVGFFLVLFIVLVTISVFMIRGYAFDRIKNFVDGVLVFDSLSFYFLVLVIMLGLYSQVSFIVDIERHTRLFLVTRLLFRCASFVVDHAVLFWCFYELSMLPLLFLIFRQSPYSERFLAGWYFACYLVVTSLPLILILIYIGLIKGNFFFSAWELKECKVGLLLVLAFIFFTKVPLVPFHTWLPIVHAEATSIVSIFLSGYIMKLGLLGVYRCCGCIFNKSLFVYLLLTLVVCVMFLLTSCTELDGKRWLAFLRLSHIVIPFFGLFIGDWLLVNNSFFYCLGHGLRAGIVFGLLWYFYEICGSRKWLLLKSSVGGKVVMLGTVVRFLRLCSFPPTIQFFCEVGLISVSYYKLVYIVFWCLYLFFGGLVPLVLVGHVLVRCEYVEKEYCGYIKFFNFFFFLCFWCYLGLFIM